MQKIVLISAALVCSPIAASAQQAAPAPASSPADDATKFVTAVIDKFNGGDVNALVGGAR